MHIQLLHTSASLAINENWDPDVRDDMEMMLNRIVPEDMPFRHSCEGPDDMVKFHKFNYQFNIIVSVSEANITTSIGSESPKNPKCRYKKSSIMKNGHYYNLSSLNFKIGKFSILEIFGPLRSNLWT